MKGLFRGMWQTVILEDFADRVFGPMQDRFPATKPTCPKCGKPQIRQSRMIAENARVTNVVIQRLGGNPRDLSIMTQTGPKVQQEQTSRLYCNVCGGKWPNIEALLKEAGIIKG